MERTIENKLLIQAFNAFLASQTKAERNLFVARYWYGLPVEEIAAKLGIKKNTALSTLRRMRLRLRRPARKGGLAVTKEQFFDAFGQIDGSLWFSGRRGRDIWENRDSARLI